MQHCDGDCELGGAGDRVRDPVRHCERQGVPDRDPDQLHHHPGDSVLPRIWNKGTETIKTEISILNTNAGSC